MWMDAVDIRDFYAGSLGEAARRAIVARIREIWPDLSGMNVLGIGYATPYLEPFRGEAARVMAAMPAAQGVLHWPTGGPGATTLADEAELPFPDLSIDRVLLVHALEFTEQIQPMMREIWRILSGSGHLLVVVPNRRGIWARLERTPFGQGHPYTPGQLSRLLRETMFTPLQSHTALYVPPIRSRMVLSSAPAWEEMGSRWFTTFAGVAMIEAIKQIYAGHTQFASRRRAYLQLVGGNRRVSSGGMGGPG